MGWLTPLFARGQKAHCHEVGIEKLKAGGEEGVISLRGTASPAPVRRLSFAPLNPCYRVASRYQSRISSPVQNKTSR